MFSSKKLTKFGPFGFHFSKGADKLRVWIPAMLRGNVDKKMERPKVTCLVRKF